MFWLTGSTKNLESLARRKTSSSNHWTRGIAYSVQTAKITGHLIKGIYLGRCVAWAAALNTIPDGHHYQPKEGMREWLCTCVAMLLTWEQPIMCHVQATICLILCQAGKFSSLQGFDNMYMFCHQVFNRLQTFGLCLLPVSRLKLLGGEEHM